MPRLPPLTLDQMTPPQRKVADEIFATRGIGGGPFEVWLRSPELADRAQKLGAFLRYHSSLSRRLTEFVILVTARHWQAQFEWAVHENEARKAGLELALIEALRAGQRPAAMTPEEAAVYDLMQELHATRAVSPATYAAAHAILGETGLVELVGTIGYYSLIAMTLNIFECATPDGTLPLAPLG